MATTKSKKKSKSKSTGKDPGRNPTLEAKLLEDPDDTATYLVYADWLQTRGDPRGELIMLHHAGKTKEANALIKKHSAHFLGPLVDYTKPFDGSKDPVFEWHLGFIRSARFAFDTNYLSDVIALHAKERAKMKDAPKLPEEDDISFPKALVTLLSHPSGAFLRDLNVAMHMLDDGCYFEPICKAIAKQGAPSIRRLRLGEYLHAGPRDSDDSDYNYENSWTTFGDIRGLWKPGVLPRLEHLIMQGNLGGYMGRGAKIGPIVAPKLTHIEVKSGGIGRANVQALATATWRELRHLEIWFGSSDYGAQGGLRDIAPILDGVGLPKLKYLGLMNAEYTDEICEALPSSKILPRLEELSLALGTMSDHGAEVLARNRAAFKHLRVLDLEHSFLSKKGQALVKGLCREVKLAQQEKPETGIYERTGGRYVSVSE